jgi:hypothetical protein
LGPQIGLSLRKNRVMIGATFKNLDSSVQSKVKLRLKNSCFILNFFYQHDVLLILKKNHHV